MSRPTRGIDFITLNHPNMAAAAELARQALVESGFAPAEQTIDWALALHSGAVTAKAYQPAGESQLERVAQQILLLAALSDSDGQVPAVFFGSKVIEPAKGPNIDLSNLGQWVQNNRPKSSGSTRLAAAMTHLLARIARERRGRVLDQMARGVNVGAPLVPMRPYLAVLVAWSAPNDSKHCRRLLEVTSATPIRWVFVVPSTCAVTYEQMLADQPNAHLVVLNENATELADKAVFEALTTGLGDWYRRQPV